MKSPPRKPENSQPLPLTFDISRDKHQELTHLVKRYRAGSMSKLVRHALGEFDFERFRKESTQNRQISVRIPLGQREKLQQFATKKGVSLGQLMRAAIEQYLDDPSEPGISKDR